MPDKIRVKRGSRARLRDCGRLALTAALFPLWSATVYAQQVTRESSTYAAALVRLERHEIAALALTVGIVVFAVLAAILLVRTRAKAAAAEVAARRQLSAFKAEIDLAHTLLMSEPQVIVTWPAATDQAASIIGDPSILVPASAPHRVLAFGTWLSAERARVMEHAVEGLRAHGEGFQQSLITTRGQHVEAEGRAVGGRAVLRLRLVSGVKRDLVDVTTRYQQLQSDVDALRILIETLPSPVWTRDSSGRLTFVNSAYAHAVDAENPDDAVLRNIELLDRAARDELNRSEIPSGLQTARLPAVVAGNRRILDVLNIPTLYGAVGIGIDVTEAENAHAEIANVSEAHRRTLDHLSIGVAIFGADQRLKFYNAAYRALWEIDPAFLDQGPSDAAILDRLRLADKLPAQQDFRQWRRQLHEAYRAIEPHQHEWHLPDGRTLRVVTTPNPEGGATYLFDDVTERLDLERRFDALIRVQGETLDNLAEAVAVFGSNGRVRLVNPVFTRMWNLDPEELNEFPHIETLISRWRALYEDNTTWQALQTAVTALDERGPLQRRIERKDDSVIDLATLPLPDGATLVTFQDVTDSVNVERALRERERALSERNQALVAADQLKIDFVHHVSYELRSPLTNIIGFAHFLGDPSTGPLTNRQREYLGYITFSTNALLAIINNILDLATIDAGAMTLNLGPVDIRQTMEAAAEGIQDRLVKDGIALDIAAAKNIGTFIADERRVRQILFNLLSNAVGFSPSGSTVTLAAERRHDAITFSVTDHGPGIPKELKDKVFDWFQTDSRGSHHRGVGLGLSIVRSFVELHGGTVKIDSAVGGGTTVVCIFPLDHSAEQTAAE
jgi:signal transduction histidine kinase